TGAIFISCDEYDVGQKISAKDGAKVGKNTAFSIELLTDTTIALGEKVCREMEELQPDCIVVDSMAPWGKAAAKKLGIPFVMSNTTFAFNKHSAKIMKQSFWDTLMLILSMPKIDKNIKRLRREGYPIKSFIDLIGSDEKAETIVYTSKEFQPCAETFADNYAFVGPSIRPAESNVEKTKDKLIYISMGTVNNDLKKLYKQFISDFAESGYHIIMSVGNIVDIAEFGEIPDNISVHAHVDQIAVLQKADLFISHCGMNSVSESLYFGVPLVMLPQTSEQKGVAERVRQLGAGVRPEKSDSKSIMNAVAEIFADDKYRNNAESIAESFRRCSGAKGAADKIEKLCRR
ncbi:MAG: glucosyltransferase, partial [Firmicutes bacterium]|nr:glucosyltransferase [Bacillota bacterium]